MAMFKNILVAIDGSPTAGKGLRCAIELARDEGAALTIFCVLDLYAAAAEMQMATAGLYTEHLELLRRQARQWLDAAATQAAAAGVKAGTQLYESGTERISEAIATRAGQGFDLVVLGTHGRRGFRRFFLGSNAEQVLRTAPVPVLLVRADEQGEA